MKKLAPVLLIVALAGCDSLRDASLRDQVALACASYSTALDLVTPLKGQMSPAQVAVVDNANVVVQPTCNAVLAGALEPTNATLSVVSNRTDELSVIKASVEAQ